MIRLTSTPCLLVAAGLCGLYDSPFAAAVVAKPNNDSFLQSHANSNAIGGGANFSPSHDAFETSQTRVNQVDGPLPKGSDNRASGKDYDSGGYQVQNTYGPPRDYFYDERPEYFRPGQAGLHNYQQNRPSEMIYHQQYHHQQQYPLQHHYGPSGGGGGHHSGELNIQPLLWPLAGITLLGVLSALVKTPLLLHLGTVAGRRRRAVDDRDDGAITAETIKTLLGKFNDKGRHDRVNSQPCLVCDVVASIYDHKSACVERSVCEVMSRNGPGGVETDKRLFTAMIAQVVRNDQIPVEFRNRLKWAESKGRTGSNCGQMYPCHKRSEQN